MFDCHHAKMSKHFSFNNVACMTVVA